MLTQMKKEMKRELAKPTVKHNSIGNWKGLLWDYLTLFLVLFLILKRSYMFCKPLVCKWLLHSFWFKMIHLLRDTHPSHLLSLLGIIFLAYKKLSIIVRLLLKRQPQWIVWNRVMDLPFATHYVSYIKKFWIHLFARSTQNTPLGILQLNKCLIMLWNWPNVSLPPNMITYIPISLLHISLILGSNYCAMFNHQLFRKASVLP